MSIFDYLLIVAFFAIAYVWSQLADLRHYVDHIKRTQALDGDRLTRLEGEMQP